MNFRVTACLVALLGLIAGCSLFHRPGHPLNHRQPPPPARPTFSQYHLEGWDWQNVARVLVLPFLNESAYTRAGDEVRAAFGSELQRLGQFEVVTAPPDDWATLSATIHRNGRFDEIQMLDIARLTQADVVVFGVVTYYSPYPRPRLGMVIQAVSPREGKVVASVDGLWDSSDIAIAERARASYRQTPRERPPWIRNNVIVGTDAFTAELVLESPALYQRFVCNEAALTLVGLPVPGIDGFDGALPGSSAKFPLIGRRPVPCGQPLLPISGR